MEPPSDVGQFTQLLRTAQTGDEKAEKEFCELVNEELRREAARLVRSNYPGVQPTSLVNELFVRLFRKGVTDDLKNRRYFFSVAIDQMRKILRERVRKRQTQTEGGHLQQQPLDIVLDQYLDHSEAFTKLDFVVLDGALKRLKAGAATARQYEILNLYYFVGFDQADIAQWFDIDPSVVSKELKTVLAKLKLEVRGDA